MSGADMDQTTDEAEVDLRHPPCGPIFDSEAGISIPGYETLSKIGAGGMGVVYCVRQLALDRVVALKTVHWTRKNSDVALARFIREAKTVASLRHPNIVTAFDYGEHAGIAYFTMELLDGSSLDSRLTGGERLDDAFAWHVIHQAAAGLAHAEAHGIIHRDIKPANIFLTPAPTGFPLPAGVPLVKVTDFGLACFNDPASLESEDKLTQHGAIIGTPVYMAPELFGRGGSDIRADIYALGVTAFEMLAGQAPFRGQTIWEIVEAKHSDDWFAQGSVSAHSRALISEMTREDPSDRPQTYQDLLARIDALLARLDASRSHADLAQAAAPKPPLSRKRVLRWIGLVLAFVALSAVAIVLVRGRSNALSHPAGYVPASYDSLFGGNALPRWRAISGQWAQDIDAENATVLAGKGTTLWPTPSTGDYRLAVSVDLFEAGAVELQFAIAGSGKRMALRVSKAEGICVGTRAGIDQPLKPLTPWLPFEPDGSQSPYAEMRVERLGNGWFVFFKERYMGGWRDDGLEKTPAFHLVAEGGAARFTEIEIAKMSRAK